MKRIVVALLLGFLVSVIATQHASAQTCCQPGGSGWRGMGEGMPMMSPMHHDGMEMMGRGHHLWKYLAGLGLDEKQKEAIKEIRSRVMKESIRKKADLDVARVDLRDLLGKDQVDMGAVETALKKIASLETDMHLLHIKAMQEIKAKLTPEQRKKAKEMRESGPMAGNRANCNMSMAPNSAQEEAAMTEKEQ